MPDSHAILAPSSAHRWLVCTPSARKEAEVPSQDSIFTIEGTIAHAVAEFFLRDLLVQGYEFAPTLEETWTAVEEGLRGHSDRWLALRQLKREAEQNGFDFSDMIDIVYSRYVYFVFEDFLEARRQDPNAELMVEAVLKLDDFIPEGFGSSDAVIVGGHTLRVYDLKYGKGVRVSAENNPQMKCYAIGALFGPAEPWLIKDVVMTIIQPRLNNVSSWGLSALALADWADNVLRPTAEIAFSGGGAYAPGAHCKFCRIAARCRALKNYKDYLMMQVSDPSLLTSAEVGEALKTLAVVKEWCSHLEGYAMRTLGDGGAIPGWKLVEGRSIRRIGDTAGAVEVLKSTGLTDDEIYKPRELRAISDLEKLVGKKNFGPLVGAYVVKPEGKPTLAPVDDPREAIKPATAEQAFAGLL